MKRDMLLCAEIIKHFGDNDGDPQAVFESDHDEGTTRYHARLLRNAGFISDLTLTMSGWDFYAYATRPDFKAVHDEILRIIGGVPYPLLTEMLDKAAKARAEEAMWAQALEEEN
jgi:hypothetical protein